MAALLLLVAARACVPIFGPYRFVALEVGAGIQVTQSGPAMPASGSLFIHDIPLAYRLVRDGYTVDFSINPKDDGPHLLIRAATPDGGPAPTIRFVDPPDTGDACGTMYESSFVSLPGFIFRADDCPSGNPPKQHVLAFRVVSEKGDELGRERIPFYVRNNGFFFYVDAL